MSKIKDTKLAFYGMQRYRWALDHMPVLSSIIQSTRSKPLSGLRIGFCLQLTAETAALILGAKMLGAKVSASSGNPLTTDDAVAAYLDSMGINVYGWSGQTVAEFAKCADAVMYDLPDILSDDGAELSVRAHTDDRFSRMNILGGTEETTTGVHRILALQSISKIRYPIIAVNDADTKRMFDNRYGTGQSVIDGLLRATGLLLASKIAVVSGYGWVGRGVAERLCAMGSHVIVTEVDPTRALQAHMDGYEVMPMAKAVQKGQIFVTCTGNSKVITAEHMCKMHTGAILANAGHFDVEIDVASLGRGHLVRPGLQEHKICGKKIYIVSHGRVVNLVAAEGHPPEIMDLSFSNHLLCIMYLCNTKMPNLIHKVPNNIDEYVACSALHAARIQIDK
ncbi:MAG: adenosylhomocysteinase [Cenarchaeum symbiont of Oopsacas minuta]|nr:adenosylhomocysteinase [Cenarchaeum symbiont of Oopsacas minuta]